MLPELKTREQQIKFANDMLAILMQNEEVKKYIGEDAKPFPSGMLDKEFDFKIIGETDYHAEDAGHFFDTPARNMKAFMLGSEDILMNLQALRSPDAGPEEIDIALHGMDAFFSVWFDPKINSPLQTTNSYLERYGAKSLSSPGMQFVMGMVQGLSSVNDVMEEMSSAPDPEQAELKDSKLSALDTEIRFREESFAKLAAQQGMEPENVVDFEQTRQAAETNCQKRQADLNKATADALESKAKVDTDLVKATEEVRTAQDKILAVEKEVSALNNVLNKLTDHSSLTADLKSIRRTSQKAQELRRKYAGEDALLADVQKKQADKRRELEPLTREFDDMMAVPDHAKTIGDYTASLEAHHELQQAYEQLQSLHGSVTEEFKNAVHYLNTDDNAASWKLPQEIRGPVQTYFRAMDAIKSYYGSGSKGSLADELSGSNMDRAIETLAKGENNELKTFIDDLGKDIENMQKTNAVVQKHDEIIRKSAAIKQEISELGRTEKKYLANSKRIENEEKSLKSWQEAYQRSLKFAQRHIEALPEDMKPREEMDPTKPEEFTEKYIRCRQGIQDRLNAKKAELQAAKNDLSAKGKQLREIKVEKKFADNIVKAQSALTGSQKKLESLNTMKLHRDKAMAAMEQKDQLLKDSDLTAQKNNEQRRKDSFKKTLDTFKNSLKEGNRAKNSEEYNALQNCLQDASDVFSDSTKTKEEQKRAIDELQKAADKYIREKEKQWRPWPFASEQRFARLEGAKQVLQFCKNAGPIVENAYQMNRENLKSMVLDAQNFKKPTPEERFNMQTPQKVEQAARQLPEQNQPQQVNVQKSTGLS